MDMKIREKNIPVNLAALKAFQISELNQGLYDIFEWAKEKNIKVHGGPFSIFYDFLNKEGKSVCGLSVRGENLESTDDIEIVNLEEHKVLSSMHIGDYGTVGETYTEIIDYASENDYIVTGPTYIIFMNNPFYTEKERLISEVQVTVEK